MSPVEVRSAESAPLDVVRKEEKAVSDEIFLWNRIRNAHLLSDSEAPGHKQVF